MHLSTSYNSTEVQVQVNFTISPILDKGHNMIWIQMKYFDAPEDNEIFYSITSQRTYKCPYTIGDWQFTASESILFYVITFWQISSR